jgi:hypothetical protein
MGTVLATALLSPVDPVGPDRLFECVLDTSKLELFGHQVCIGLARPVVIT